MDKQVKLIDEKTIAVQHEAHIKFQSKITKLDGIYYSEKTPTQLLNEACLEYASTLKGRKQAVFEVFNYYKAPFIVSPFETAFFPTSSSKNFHCSWIGTHPFKVTELENGLCQLIFYDSIHVIVQASPYTIYHQHLRLNAVINHFRNKEKK